MHNAFGDPKHYYSDMGQKTVPPSAHEMAVYNLLGRVDPELNDTVERACKRWNQILREHLRTETGFRFSFKETQRNIPVRVKDGLPLPLSRVVANFDQIVWELLMHRRALTETLTGLEIVTRKYNEIEKIISKPSATVEQITHTRNLVREIKQKLDEYKIIEQIMAIKQDTLGAYFFRIPEIQIYWMVIGLLSALLQVSVEGLAVVVLTHELAHAYTHLGYDIDGRDWNTAAFAAADLEIVEGLAQHYTKTICESTLATKFPQASEAYKALVNQQTDPYRIHEQWTDDKNEDKSGEIIRFTMINTRLKNIQNIDDFENERATVKKLVATKGR